MAQSYCAVGANIFRNRQLHVNTVVYIFSVHSLLPQLAVCNPENRMWCVMVLQLPVCICAFQSTHPTSANAVIHSTVCDN